MLNSRLGLVTATPSRSSRRAFTLPGHPFSRSYGVKLPSSLTKVPSPTLGYSPCPPVSVCGTVASSLASGFSWQLRPNLLGRGRNPASHSPLGHRRRDFPPRLPTSFDARYATLGLPHCVPASLVTGCGGTGMYHPFSIAYGSRPRLRTD